MKPTYLKKLIAITLICFGLFTSFFIISCAESKKITAKSGALLWSENCQRCHNTPPPQAFSQEQWKTIGMHMQSRALLTTKERDKIVQFLQQSN